MVHFLMVFALIGICLIVAPVVLEFGAFILTMVCHLLKVVVVKLTKWTLVALVAGAVISVFPSEVQPYVLGVALFVLFFRVIPYHY